MRRKWKLEPSGLLSMGLLRVGHNWVTDHLTMCTHLLKGHTTVYWLHTLCQKPSYSIESSWLTFLDILKSHFMVRKLKEDTDFPQILVTSQVQITFLLCFPPNLISNHHLLHWLNETSLQASDPFHCHYLNSFFLNMFIIWAQTYVLHCHHPSSS